MGLLSKACERMVDGLIAALHAARGGDKAKIGEQVYLSGVFKPQQEELPPTALQVTAGELPAGLSGLCVRARVGAHVCGFAMQVACRGARKLTPAACWCGARSYARVGPNPRFPPAGGYHSTCPAPVPQKRTLC
jgi:hypothetical protein